MSFLGSTRGTIKGLIFFLSKPVGWRSCGVDIVGGRVVLFVTVFFTDMLRTRAVGVEKAIASADGRALPNMSVAVGNARAKAMDSTGNGCDVETREKGILRFAFINVMGRSIAMKGRGIVGVRVTTSTVGLSRMITVKCNVTGGDSLANTITSVGSRGLAGSGMKAIAATLRKLTTNIRIAANSMGPNKSTSIIVHKMNSLQTNDRPLCVISNVPMRKNLRSLSSNSVRSVRVLGSTSSTSVCNSENSGNMMLIAAGGNADKGTGVSLGTSFNARQVLGGRSLVGTRRCCRLMSVTRPGCG